MDHLALPQDPILPLTRVPYVCTEHYDVNIPLLEYASRKGKPWMVEEDGQVTFELHELACFLQTWSFFGFLAETLGDLHAHDTFVTKSLDTKERILTTRDLQPLIEKRIAWIATLEKAVQKQLFEHAGKCIDITWKAQCLDILNLDPRIKYSIGAVAEFIASAIDKAHLTAFPGSDRCRKPFANGFYTEEIKERMVKAN